MILLTTVLTASQDCRGEFLVQLPHGEYVINFEARPRPIPPELSGELDRYLNEHAAGPAENLPLLGWALNEASIGPRSGVRSLVCGEDYWNWKSAFVSKGTSILEYSARDSRGDWRGFYAIDKDPELRLSPSTGQPPLDGLMAEFHYARTLLERVPFSGCVESSCQHEVSLASVEYAFPDDMGLKPIAANELGGISVLRLRRDADEAGSTVVIEWVNGWGDAYCELRARMSPRGYFEEAERTYFFPGRREVPLFSYFYSVGSYIEGPASLGELFCPSPGTGIMDERLSDPVHYIIGESCNLPTLEELRQAIKEAKARGVSCEIK